MICSGVIHVLRRFIVLMCYRNQTFHFVHAKSFIDLKIPLQTHTSQKTWQTVMKAIVNSKDC